MFFMCQTQGPLNYFNVPSMYYSHFSSIEIEIREVRGNFPQGNRNEIRIQDFLWKPMFSISIAMAKNKESES